MTATTLQGSKPPDLKVSEAAESPEPEQEHEAAESGEEEGAPKDGISGSTNKKKSHKKRTRRKAKPGGKAADDAAKQDDGSCTVPVSQQFPAGKYPQNEFFAYDGGYLEGTRAARAERTDAQIAEREEYYNDLRRAAEVHRQVRHMVQRKMQPGMKMIDICDTIEDGTRRMVEASGLDCGIAFPTGCSLNHVAAHWTPNPGDTTVLQETDVCKIDFGVHVNGHIIDSAFTWHRDARYDPLVQAVREATDTAVRLAGVDVPLNEIGGAVNEVMLAHEMDAETTRPLRIRPCRNLNGHTLERYKIHAGKSVPIVDNGDTTRMAEGEQYALETFGSTGNGYVNEEGECSHYMLDYDLHHAPRGSAAPPRFKHPKAKALLGTIERNFSTLAFCKRYLHRLGEERYLLPLRELCQEGIVTPYPPLCDVKDSFTAQFEHCLVLREDGKEVLTRGDDY